MEVFTYLGLLVQLRRNTANKSSVCGAHTGFDHTGFAPSHSMYASQSTLLKLQVALQGNYLKRALG